MDLLAALNPAQREAVTHPGGPLLILAGAGSGKTRVLTHRIAYLLEQGEHPRRIIAITFTNKAAGEMKERVEALVGSAALGDMWVSTFHSACVRLLRAELGRLGRRSDFVIYDSADHDTLIRDCLKEANLSDRQWPPAAVGGTISRAKNRLWGPGEFAAQAGDFYHERVAEVYQLYQRRLKENNAMDFDDLILEAVRLFREHPGVRRRYQERFRHVLVDEYQDTNYAQYELVKWWAGVHRNVFVVGDDDQSIYRFRGADVSNILSFEKDYPDAKVVKLEENYRSTQNILDSAYYVVSQNLHRKEKRLWTRRPTGEPAVVCSVDDGHQEAEFVAREVERRVTAGVMLSQCAVLYRTHAQSRAFEEMFVRLGVPYEIAGGVRFYERKEIKDLLAYLRLLVNPYDYLSLRRVANVPRRGLGDASMARIEEYGRTNQLPVVTLLEEAGTIEGVGARQARAAGALARLLAELAAAAEGAAVSDIIERTLHASGLRGEIQRVAADMSEVETRLEILEEFLSVAREYDLAPVGEGLRGFLESIALMTDVDRLDQRQDRVVMMSLHSAKGLEFDTVFLVGLEEGLFPHVRSFDDPHQLEEERRLCYVGMTRAQNRLFLSWARQRLIFGRTNLSIRSRFLNDIPKELVESICYPERAPVRPQVLAATRPAADVGTFKPGDRVRHVRFGHGTIVAVQGTGEGAQVAVAFPGNGIKQLMVQYAGLEKDGG